MAKKFNQPFLRPEHQQRKLNKILTIQRDNDIINMLLDGLSTKEIAKYLYGKYGMKYPTAVTTISQCRREVKNRREFELNNVISIHIHRYEYIYHKLIEIGAEGIAMNALKAKEKLLGFHREGFHMKVTQGEVQQLYQTHVNNEYDLKKLDEKKRTRFEQLILKARRIKDEQQRLTTSKVRDSS